MHNKELGKKIIVDYQNNRSISFLTLYVSKLRKLYCITILINVVLCISIFLQLASKYEKPDVFFNDLSGDVVSICEQKNNLCKKTSLINMMIK